MIEQGDTFRKRQGPQACNGEYRSVNGPNGGNVAKESFIRVKTATNQLLDVVDLVDTPGILPGSQGDKRPFEYRKAMSVFRPLVRRSARMGGLQFVPGKGPGSELKEWFSPVCNGLALHALPACHPLRLFLLGAQDRSALLTSEDRLPGRAARGVVLRTRAMLRGQACVRCVCVLVMCIAVDAVPMLRLCV